MKNETRTRLLWCLILVLAVAYCARYFNYFETPSGDYIGNVLPPVLDYQKGNFPGTNYKFLPLFPVILALLSPLCPSGFHDPVYMTAMALNLILYIPFLIVCALLFRRFLDEKAGMIAIILLSLNMNTVYMVVNAELEMVLTFLIVLSLWLTMRDSKLAYLTAFFTATTKWDSVFAVPAVMFRDFFYSKKRVAAIALGSLASAGAVAWLALSVVHTVGAANPYVGEIAHRGPNVYRYLGDCFLVLSGFIPWMGTQAYYAESSILKASLFAATVPAGIITLAGLITGIYVSIKKWKRDLAPVFVFFAGFLLIHMVYQNTKSRYVIPILWLLTFFMCAGIAEIVLPAVKVRFERLTPRGRKLLAWLLSYTGLMTLVLTWIAVALGAGAAGLVFAFLFFALIAAVVLSGTPRSKRTWYGAAVLWLAITANLMLYYGHRAMDHYGLHRVEFKKAALWYRDTATPGDRMLIAEWNVPMYYSGFREDRFFAPFLLKSTSIGPLADELAANGVTLVFVDDFYVRRLKFGDPNAIDRRAELFKLVLEQGERSGRFELVRTFETTGGITSRVYRIRERGIK